jgi:excisionase family DNA binding protein
MSSWTAENTNSNEMTSTVKKEEVVPRMNTTTTPSPQRLEQAMEAFVEDLEGLEGAVQRFEEALLELDEGALEEGALEEGAPVHHNGQSSRLLSPSEVCQELEADRASVYRRLRSGEIPALKLGSALKVRRADLEGYMKVKGRKHLRLVSEENGFRER